MDNRPIGIFDSGLGGLTAVRALRQMLPAEDIVYFADSGRLPYGGRSRSQLRRMARQDLDLMASYGVKAVVVACGTLSSNAPDLLEENPIPSFGVLKASVDAMAQMPGTGALGIIATEATIRSGAFEAALREKCPGREIIALPCPKLVPLIEFGHIDPSDPLLQAAMDDLAPLQGADALLLGCTHYGIVAEAIQKALGPSTRLLEASACGARAVRDFLTSRDLTGGQGRELYLTSGPAEDFQAAASLFLGRERTILARHIPAMEAGEP